MKMDETLNEDKNELLNETRETIEPLTPAPAASVVKRGRGRPKKKQ